LRLSVGGKKENRREVDQLRERAKYKLCRGTLIIEADGSSETWARI